MGASNEAGGNPSPESQDDSPLSNRAKRFLFGPARDLNDRGMFHKLSVIAFFAWVGLGADGLSSSSYGPEEAFRALGTHTYLAIPIALMTAATILIISTCYSRIIEQFPHGGGGYVVATSLLGEKAGVISGSALLVDYVLTITVSIAAAGDAIFSFLPPEWQGMKLGVEVFLIIALTALNIRGVKESIMVLLPVFLVFLGTHIVLIGGGFFVHAEALPSMVSNVKSGFDSGLTTLGIGGMMALLLHAYSLGGGTYTGLEAVSNGLTIMREPRVRTAKRTMVYMAISLALTAGGLCVCYLLWGVQFVEGKTLNAVLADRVAGGLALGGAFVVVTLLSEGLLLVVGAQAGFIDGPRVLANMASDAWLPRRFASVSDRLTTQNGIVLMGVTALGALLYTNGKVSHLVVMYSINVFLTFSMSMFGMSRHFISKRGSGEPWKGQLSLFGVGFVFCATILVITVYQKFSEGGWVTLAITATVVCLCFLIKRHYRTINAKLSSLYASLHDIPPVTDIYPGPVDPTKPVAAVLVGGYSGLGIHTTLKALRSFPAQFRGIVFISAGVVDSGAIKDLEALDLLKARTEVELAKYVTMMEGQGMPAVSRMTIGTDVVEELEKLCLNVAQEFPHATFFAGQLVFEKARWYEVILHNETAFALQRRLQLAEKTLIILPARVR
jgi:amino acid transporter